MFNKLFTISATTKDLQRRGQVIITIALLFVGLIILTLPLALTRINPLPSLAASGIGLLTALTASALARTGHITLASWSLVVFAIIAILLPVLIRRETGLILLYLLIPLVVAGVVLRPWEIWIVLAATLMIVGLGWIISVPEARANENTLSLLVTSVTLITTVGLISFLGAIISSSAFAASAQARQEAEASAKQLAQLNTSLEDQVAEQTAELRSALADVKIRMGEKQSLLDEVATQREQIREMSMPVLPVDKHTLVLPLVGALDSQRLLQLQDQALAAIELTGARTLLLDVTGVHVIDSQVAQGLIRTVQAVRLLGAEPVLIGVRPEVAQTLVALGIDLTGLRTASDLQGALHRSGY